MQNGLIPFEFEDKQVRIFPDENNEVWLVAKDVCLILDYSESSISQLANLLRHVPEEWKGIKRINTLGGNQEMLCLSEQGLYFFLGRSDKPRALPFQKWMAGEVLPTLRKTGSYTMPGAKPAPEVGSRESVTEGVRRFEANALNSPFRLELSRVRDNAAYLAGIFGFESESAVHDLALCYAKLLYTHEPLDSVEEDFELTPKKLSYLWNATKAHDEERTPPHDHLRSFLLLAKYMEKRLSETRTERLEKNAHKAMADYLAASTSFEGAKTFEITVTPK